MSIPGATIMYVCDLRRLHHLLMSITSWQRFAAHPVSIVDIGLTEFGRRAVADIAAAGVQYLTPGNTPPIPDYVPDRQRGYAYAQKTLVGALGGGNPMLFLDSDILVVHQDFLPRLAAVAEGEFFAMPSVWDEDFAWTYTPSSLPQLRKATGQPEMTLAAPICNSGVWAMRRGAAEAVAPRWHKAFRSALDAVELHDTLRPGTQIGDQEFLVPACNAAGVLWRHLHGSFNMQVHERLMPWADGPDGHPLGGRRSECPEPVLAIHYGCEPDGTVRLTSDMIASASIREWIQSQYRVCFSKVSHGTDGRLPGVR